MAILLIRHGETEGNRNRVVQLPETPLSDRGVAQARRLARRLTSHSISRIVSSDLARARMTAEALRDASGVSFELDPLLQERNFGDHRGRAYADLGLDMFAEDHAPPNGETWDGFHARVDDAWRRIQEIAAGCADDVAVVTHGLVCHSLVSRKLDLPTSVSAVREGNVLRFGNTALTVFEARAPFSVSLFACTAHLDEASGDDADAISGI